MKKIVLAVIGVVVVTAFAGELFRQQQAIAELRQDNEKWKAQAEQVPALQEQLAKAAQEQAARNDSAQVHELAKLRSEVTRLRAQTNELTKARSQIQALQGQVAAEKEARNSATAAAAAALAAAAQPPPAPAAPKEISELNACINNLRMIDAAKQQWALENKKSATEVPRIEDLTPYLVPGPNGAFPVCPSGGTYTAGPVQQKPTCSIPGHVLQ